MSKTRERAIDLILERGVAWRCPAPLALRAIGIRHIRMSIKPLYLGTILEIARLVDRDEAVDGNYMPQAEMIALAVLNGKWRIRLLRKWLTRYLIRHVRSDSLIELAQIVMRLSRQADFMTITIWGTQLAQIVMPTEREGS